MRPASVARSSSWLERYGYEVRSLELAFLNAGVDSGGAFIADVSDEAYERVRGANLDGVVYGVRRLRDRAGVRRPASRRHGGARG